MAISNVKTKNESSSSVKNILDPEAKKLLRYLDDTSKRLDDYTGRCNTVFELFSSAGAPIILRSRLRELVWRALRVQDSAPGIKNKALDLGWRKIYYEPIHVARQLKKRGSWNNADAAYVESHLTNGIGHYHGIISFVCHQYSTRRRKNESTLQPLDEIIDSLQSLQTSFVNDYGFDNGGLEFPSSKPTMSSALAVLNVKESNAEEAWVKDALHRCYTALGDLSRYRLEFEELSGDKGSIQSANSVAIMYYSDALLVNPKNGMPFNQLAALSSSKNFGLDSVYYYLRCLTSEIPFKGCEPNLQNLFQQNTHKLNKLETSICDEDGSNNLTAKEECERSVMYLLRLLQELLFEDSTKRLANYCQKALHHVQKCLYLPNHKEKTEAMDEVDSDSILSNVNQSLSSDVSSKMVIVLLLVISKLSQGAHEIKVSMIKAYLLALFSHFVTKLVGDAYFCIFGPEAMTDLFLNELNEMKEIEEGEQGDQVKCENISDNNSISEENSQNEGNDDQKYLGVADNTSKKRSTRKKFHDVLRRKRRSDKSHDPNRDSNSDVSSKLSYSSHESVASTYDDSSEDDNRGKYFDRKRKSKKYERNKNIKGTDCSGEESDSELSSFYSDEDGAEPFISSDAESYSDDKQEKSKSEEESSDEGDDVIVESATEVFSGLDIVKFMSQHHLIPAIRIAILWLMESEDLVKEAGESSSILWFRLSKLFNILPVGIDFTHSKFLPNSHITSMLKKILVSGMEIESVENDISAKWKNVPMPEDQICKGTNLLINHQANLQWDETDDFAEEDENDIDVKRGLLRILQINDFCDWLTTLPNTRLGIKQTHDDEEEQRNARIIYLMPLSKESVECKQDLKADHSTNNPELNVNTTDTILPADAEGNDRKSKTDMMQNMAQLWLQQEVKDLEMSNRVNSRTYIVIDHWALISHLNLVKDVVDSRRFVVVIPSATIQQLDDMKRRNNDARVASRWLERQFEKGNRWLRPQKGHEKKLVDRLAYPKRKQRDDWYLIKIVECCNHFINMRSNNIIDEAGASKNIKMNVTWITSSESTIIDSLQKCSEIVSLHEKSTDNEIGGWALEVLEADKESALEETNNQNQIYSFLKTTAGESLNFESIQNFVAENNITRPKIEKNDGSDSTRVKSSSVVKENRRKRFAKLSRSSATCNIKNMSDTDVSEKSVCHSPQRRRRHKRYRLRKDS